MTIMSVAKGVTTTFGKIHKLQNVYARWKDGSLDLTPKARGKKAGSARKQPPKKGTPALASGIKRLGRPAENVLEGTVAFELPDVNEKMIIDAKSRWKS